MSDNPEECAYYLRIVRLTVDCATEAARDLLYYYKAKHSVAAFFAGKTISNELKQLKRKRVLSNEQYQRVITSPDADEFDLSLLLTLLTNVFTCMIETPVNGWNKTIDQHDTSVGADLLRLKEFRNVVIGHKSNARLSSEEFERLWGQLENILTRILKFVNGDNEDTIRAKIYEYKRKALEPNEEVEKKYLDLIQNWYDEFTSKQNEVEKLCERTEEFCLLFKSKIPERYSRYILLLYEGGLLVLTATLKEKLRKQKTDLKALLRTKRAMLLSTVKCSVWVIFESTGEINTDVSTWGISLLTEILLSLFHPDLTVLEKMAVQGIKEASENYARSALASLDGDKFRTYWTDVISNINILSAQRDETTQLECQKLIRKHDKEPVDEETVKIYLSYFLQDCRPLKSLIALYKETRNKLKGAIETMQKEGAKFGKEQALDLKMMTIGKSEEKRELAEDILFTIWQEAVNMTDGSEDFQKIKEAVNKILERIRSIDDVKIENVEKHCIILTLSCANPAGFIELLNYLNSESFFENFECISKCFCDYFSENITVTAFITMESMENVFDKLYEEDVGNSEQCTSLKLKCTSVNAVENLRGLLEDHETANTFNELAQCLSEQSDEHISIKSSLQMGGLGEVLANPLQNMSLSPWQPFLLSRTDASRRSLTLSPHLAYLQELLDDVRNPSQRTVLKYRETAQNFASSSSEDEDDYYFHRYRVHRFPSLPTVLHDDAQENLNQYRRSNIEDSPTFSRQYSPLLTRDTTGGSNDLQRSLESLFSWDDLSIHKNYNRDSSRSSSVGSFV